ncbi:MAG: hypothetical protein AAF251_06020 [Pseudomonadota bacterium]
MQEYRSLFPGFPHWAELILLAALPALIALVLVFGLVELSWLLAGPLAMAQVWINRDSPEYGRMKRPWLFWVCLVSFATLTARGAFVLFQILTEVPV